MPFICQLMKIVELNLLNILFSLKGHDTTSVAANWAIHLIGSDQEVQAKIHQELDVIFGEQFN